MKETFWDGWLERLYNLQRNKQGSHERPHKPVLLLSIIDLLDRGAIHANKIPLSEELVETFRGLFETVRKENDQPTIQHPFFHLSGDRFWELMPQRGERALYEPGSASGSPSVADLRRRVAYGRFDAGLWALLREPVSRRQLKEALIARYFPEHRTQLEAFGKKTPLTEKEAALNEELPPGRDAAFRRVILEVYDYRCAACGIRVVLRESHISLVVAAHLIPFGLSRNDKPTNGVALCPNHHWAMDRHLIAPCPHPNHRAGVWQVHPRLDNRIEGEKDLMALADRAVIPPREEKFFPASEGLQWRSEQISGRY